MPCFLSDQIMFIWCALDIGHQQSKKRRRRKKKRKIKKGKYRKYLNYDKEKNKTIKNNEINLEFILPF